MNRRKTIKGFAERLEEAICESGMSTQEISEKANVCRTHLWKYRIDGVVPSSVTLMKLCKALNVSSDYLLGLEKNKNLKDTIKTISTLVQEEAYAKGKAENGCKYWSQKHQDCCIDEYTYDQAIKRVFEEYRRSKSNFENWLLEEVMKCNQ